MSDSSQAKLTDIVGSLSPEQQSAVEAFIRYLREIEAAGRSTELRSAVDDFVREHSDLLGRLAQ